MTAFTAARTSADQGAERKRPRKAVAFGMAGIIAAAGIAGVVVTSSAYFTDTKTVAANYVKTNSVKLDALSAAGTSQLVAFQTTGLVPALSTNVDALAKEQEFQIKNVGDGTFTWRVNFVGMTATKANGTTALTTNTSSDNDGLNIADARAKLRWQFAVKEGSTWKWSGTFAGAKSVSIADIETGDPDEFTSTQAGAAMTAGGAAVEKLAAGASVPVKIRYWLNSDTTNTPSTDNRAQDLRFTFDLKFDAQQVLS